MNSESSSAVTTVFTSCALTPGPDTLKNMSHISLLVNADELAMEALRSGTSSTGLTVSSVTTTTPHSVPVPRSKLLQDQKLVEASAAPASLYQLLLAPLEKSPGDSHTRASLGDRKLAISSMTNRAA